MSAGLDTIALAVAHLERTEEAERKRVSTSPTAVAAAEKEAQARAVGSTAEQEKDDENINNPKSRSSSRQSNPRASPPMIMTVPRHHGFAQHPNARLVSADHTHAPPHHHHLSYIYAHHHHHHPPPPPHHHHHHPPPPHHPHHHPMSLSSARSSPMTVYPGQPHVMQQHQHHHHGHPHHPSPPPFHMLPHHGHHYVYAAMAPGVNDTKEGRAETPMRASPRASPTPSPPASVDDGTSRAASMASSSPSPPSPEPMTVFDMDELDRLLTSAIQTDIHATPPPEVPKNEIINTVLTNDVLCGRGGETNHHAGNIRYRQLVKICQPAYIAAKRRDKPKIAQRIVRAVRLLGGRFLKKVPEDNCWSDVGNVKAREKTSQALREGAPELRTTNKDDERPKKRKAGSPSNKPSHEVATSPHMMHPVMMPHHYLEVPPPAGMGSLSYQPSAASLQAPVAADTNEGDDSASNTNKKRRLSDNGDDGIVEATLPLSNQAVKPAPPAAAGRTSTPTSFTATVSADDDDGTTSGGSSSNLSQSVAASAPDSASCSPNSSMSVMQTPGRGPRLKLLKRRLQSTT